MAEALNALAAIRIAADGSIDGFGPQNQGFRSVLASRDSSPESAHPAQEGPVHLRGLALLLLVTLTTLIAQRLAARSVR